VLQCQKTTLTLTVASSVAAGTYAINAIELGRFQHMLIMFCVPENSSTGETYAPVELQHLPVSSSYRTSPNEKMTPPHPPRRRRPRPPRSELLQSTSNEQPTRTTSGSRPIYLYRNGSLLSTTSLLVYYESGLVSGETYTYNLTAFDAAGNVSSESVPMVVETIDITAPSVPTNLVITGVTSNSVSLNWTPSTGTGGVGRYRILQGASPSAMAIRADVPALHPCGPPGRDVLLPG